MGSLVYNKPSYIIERRGSEIYIPYFSVYKTILLPKIFRLKIEARLIHGSKLRREQKRVEGKAGIKAILQRFDPFPPTLAKLHLDFLISD